jgi:hypothetical protein
MVRRNSTPQYGPKRTAVRNKDEVWVGSKLFFRDKRTGTVMVKEPDQDPYPAEPDEIPHQLQNPMTEQDSE